jgi:hypothetical protein
MADVRRCAPVGGRREALHGDEALADHARERSLDRTGAVLSPERRRHRMTWSRCGVAGSRELIASAVRDGSSAGSILAFSHRVDVCVLRFRSASRQTLVDDAAWTSRRRWRRAGGDPRRHGGTCRAPGGSAAGSAAAPVMVGCAESLGVVPGKCGGAPAVDGGGVGVQARPRPLNGVLETLVGVVQLVWASSASSANRGSSSPASCRARSGTGPLKRRPPLPRCPDLGRLLGRAAGSGRAG